MSILRNDKPLTTNILNLMLAVGLACIGGSILFLVLVGMVNTSYLLTASVTALPVIMIGISIIAIGAKVSERLE